MMRIRFLNTPVKLGLMTVLTPKSEKVESEILYFQYCIQCIILACYSVEFN